MARKRAESMDQASFWALNAAGAPGKVCRPTMASTQSGAMLDFAPAELPPDFLDTDLSNRRHS